VVTLALLGMGVGIAGLVTPSTVAAGDAPATEVAAAVETAPEPEPETEIGDAVASIRKGPFTPASTEHLAVVRISVSVCGARSTGSGVVVADGLLVTAAHVVGDATLVRIDQGGITVTGEVLGVLGDGRDLALVAVDAPMAAPLVPGAPPPPGAPLTLVGYPDGGPRTAAVGARVEVAPVVATLAGGGDIIGVDVHIDPGISGGPAIDETGSLVGVVVAKEVATDTALVVATPDLRALASSALVTGTCIGSA
jgi:S1-C subfamily serine protease